jgi:RNA polymerase sigma-70 factor (ECF subfamily)
MVRDGDEDAAGILYERYARRVLGLVESKLGARLRAATEPEDVVQSVFKSMFRGVQAGHYDAPPGATLWSLLAVISVNKLRRRGSHHSAKCRDIARVVSLDALVEAEAIDDSSIEFLQICLQETLEMLRPRDREILSLRIRGHTIDEISEITNRSCRTVERCLHKSREQLASLLLEET